MHHLVAAVETRIRGLEALAGLPCQSRSDPQELQLCRRCTNWIRNPRSPLAAVGPRVSHLGGLRWRNCNQSRGSMRTFIGLFVLALDDLRIELVPSGDGELEVPFSWAVGRFCIVTIPISCLEP